MGVAHVNKFHLGVAGLAGLGSFGIGRISASDFGPRDLAALAREAIARLERGIKDFLPTTYMAGNPGFLEIGIKLLIRLNSKVAELA